jgi:RNA recognition motif-containing protein
MADSQGRSMGYGFVSFKSVEAVHKAVGSILFIF